MIRIVVVTVQLGYSKKMRKYNITITYDKDEIRELEHMSHDQIIQVLNVIERQCISQDYITSPEQYEEYTESEYDATKQHIAIQKAIEIIERDKNMNILL